MRRRQGVVLCPMFEVTGSTNDERRKGMSNLRSTFRVLVVSLTFRLKHGNKWVDADALH